MQVDRDKWNARWSEDRQGVPEPFLVECLPSLHGTSVLDLACGAGRNAHFLADQGFQVTGVDISEVALTRVRVPTVRLDLDDLTQVAELGVFDNLLLIRFAPPAELWALVPSLVNPGGAVICCALAEGRYALAEGQLLHTPKLKTLRYQNAGLHCYLFRREG